MDVAITKKQHIINTAADLFKEKGYTATSIRDLASKVGLEPSSIYSHIKSKEDLLTEICQSCATRFSNGMNEIYFQDITERKKIKALIHLHLEIAYDIPASITVFNDEWKFLHDDAKADFLESRKDYEKKFKKILTDGKKNGKFSFETFSHMKGVLKKSTLSDLKQRFPPYTESGTNLIKKLISWFL